MNDEQKKVISDLSHYQMGIEDGTENIIQMLEDELSFDDDDTSVLRDSIIRSLMKQIKGEQK